MAAMVASALVLHRLTVWHGFKNQSPIRSGDCNMHTNTAKGVKEMQKGLKKMLNRVKTRQKGSKQGKTGDKKYLPMRRLSGTGTATH